MDRLTFYKFVFNQRSSNNKKDFCSVLGISESSHNKFVTGARPIPDYIYMHCVTINELLISKAEKYSMIAKYNLPDF